MDKPLSRVEIRDWKGFTHGPSPYIIPPGASQSQQNLCGGGGILSPRKGMVPVTFENAISASTAEITQMYRYSRPEGEWVVYSLSDGTIKAGLNPS